MPEFLLAVLYFNFPNFPCFLFSPSHNHGSWFPLNSEDIWAVAPRSFIHSAKELFKQAEYPRRCSTHIEPSFLSPIIFSILWWPNFWSFRPHLCSVIHWVFFPQSCCCFSKSFSLTSWILNGNSLIPCISFCFLGCHCSVNIEQILYGPALSFSRLTQLYDSPNFRDLVPNSSSKAHYISL